MVICLSEISAPVMEGRQEMMHNLGMWPCPFLFWYLCLYLNHSWKEYLFKYLFTFYYVTHTILNTEEIAMNTISYVVALGKGGCDVHQKWLILILFEDYLMKLLLLILDRAF